MKRASTIDIFIHKAKGYEIIGSMISWGWVPCANLTRSGMLIKLRSKVLIIACNSWPDHSQLESRHSHSGDDGYVLQESLESVFVVHFGLCPPPAIASAATTVESADQHKNNSTWCAEIFQLLICTHKLRTLDHPVHDLGFHSAPMYPCNLIIYSNF